jgi:hypothetical protein
VELECKKWYHEKEWRAQRDRNEEEARTKKLESNSGKDKEKEEKSADGKVGRERAAVERKEVMKAREQGRGDVRETGGSDDERIRQDLGPWNRIDSYLNLQCPFPTPSPPFPGSRYPSSP